MIGSLSAFGTGVCADYVDHVDHDTDSPFYRANELSLDLFGTGSTDQDNGRGGESSTRFGLGAGLNYFFLQHLGIGADAYSEDAGHSFIDSTSGNLIARFPIGTSGVAPYGFIGGGYQFDKVEQWFANVGGGFEFRFQKNWGIFIDARYVFADETDNYPLGRAGFRFGF
jgi:hypothetical protein